MFSLMKSKAQEGAPTQLSVPSLSFVEKMSEMAPHGRLYMFCNPKTKYHKQYLDFHLDIETPGLGKLELRSESIEFNGELPIEEAITSLYSKFLQIKALKF